MAIAQWQASATGALAEDNAKTFLIAQGLHFVAQNVYPCEKAQTHPCNHVLFANT
jgi:hypothetical protein